MLQTVQAKDNSIRFVIHLLIKLLASFFFFIIVRFFVGRENALRCGKFGTIFSTSKVADSGCLVGIRDVVTAIFQGIRENLIEKEKESCGFLLERISYVQMDGCLNFLLKVSIFAAEHINVCLNSNAKKGGQLK
ncbi:hypothetical protein Dimus_023506 [Dionaea muscipula]